MSAAFSFTKTYHKQSYPAIAPTRPELSQAGKTVLITGASEGIGFAIAKGFIEASAAKVLITGRRQAVLDAAVASLKELPAAQTSHVIVAGIVNDMSDPVQAEQLWSRLRDEGTVVDVLVLNAAAVSKDHTLLSRGTALVWKDYDMNVRAQLDFAERFYKQTGKGAGGPKYLVHTSTLGIHVWEAATKIPSYGMSKNGGAVVMQQLAREVSPDDMQIINFNPGPVYTPAVERSSYPADSFQWNSPDLAGHFAVWAASPEAKFLHGRFVWNEWDVDELKSGEIRKKIDEDPWYLKVGVTGL